MMRMVAGLLDKTDGEVTIGGHPGGSLEARAKLAYLSDQPTFYDDLSVWEHLELVARLHGNGDWEQEGADLLGELGLYDRADDLPTTFSRGLKQKAAIAMAFVRPFDLLLVDEPFVGLDATGKTTLLKLTKPTIAARHSWWPPTSWRSCNASHAALRCVTVSSSTTAPPRTSMSSRSSSESASVSRWLIRQQTRSPDSPGVSPGQFYAGRYD
jgi:ABC-type thiamine transport system ATPase subunit